MSNNKNMSKRKMSPLNFQGLPRPSITTERPDSSRSDIISRGSIASARLSLPSIGTPMALVNPSWSQSGRNNSRSHFPLPRGHSRGDGFERFRSGMSHNINTLYSGRNKQLNDRVDNIQEHWAIGSQDRPQSTVSSITKRHAILNKKRYEHLFCMPPSPITNVDPSNNLSGVRRPSENTRRPSFLDPLANHKDSPNIDRDFVELRKRLHEARVSLISASEVTRKVNSNEMKPIIRIKRPKTSGESLQRLTKKKDDVLGERLNPEVALLNKISVLRDSYSDRIKLQKRVKAIATLSRLLSPFVQRWREQNFIRKHLMSD